MDKKIGFIGCGNMGKAILGGLIASGQISDPHELAFMARKLDEIAAKKKHAIPGNTHLQ